MEMSEAAFNKVMMTYLSAPKRVPSDTTKWETDTYEAGLKLLRKLVSVDGGAVAKLRGNRALLGVFLDLREAVVAGFGPSAALRIATGEWRWLDAFVIVVKLREANMPFGVDPDETLNGVRVAWMTAHKETIEKLSFLFRIEVETE